MLICRADVNELTVGAKAFKARVWAHVSAVVAVFDKGLKFHCSNVPEGGKDDKELRAGGVDRLPSLEETSGVVVGT